MIYETILYKACESGNIDLVKYIISMKKIDVNQKNILAIKIFYNILTIKFINDISMLSIFMELQKFEFIKQYCIELAN